jgi:hypothetical protein
VVLVVGAAFSAAFWGLLSLPARRVSALVPIPDCGQIDRAAVGAVQRCATQVGYLSYGGPLLVLAFFVVLGFVLHYLVKTVLPRMPGRLRLPSSVVQLLPPLVVTVMFAMAWSATYFGQPGPPGFIPQPVFPAVAGFLAYATVRWVPPLLTLCDRLLIQRDRLHILARLGLAALVPFLFTQWATLSGAGLPAGRLEQVTVLVGFVASVVLLAPRRPPVAALDPDVLRELGIDPQEVAGRRA